MSPPIRLRAIIARCGALSPGGEGLIVSSRGGIMRRTTAALLWVLALAASAAAQDFPSKPVKLVVPFPPGGPLDISGRMIGKELQDRWGQPVVVENKPGSTIGPEYVTKSAPDGYTLMIISSTPLVTLPHLQKVPYDVLKDLVGVTQTTLLTYAFVVNPASGIGSIQDLIARAKKEPGRLNYASAGNGSGQHLYVELLKSAAGISLTHVPYKGAAPALQAVLSGEPGMMLDVTVAVVPHVKAGKLRAPRAASGSRAVRFALSGTRDPGLARNLLHRRNAQTRSRQARRGHPLGAADPGRREPLPRARGRAFRRVRRRLQRHRAARLCPLGRDHQQEQPAGGLNQPAKRGSGTPRIPNPVMRNRLPARNCGLASFAKRPCTAGCFTRAIEVT